RHNKFNRTQIYADHRRNKKDAMRIALSAKPLSVYIRVQKGNSNTIKLSFRRKKFTPPPKKKEVVMATP
ncbi:MAG: hypothetical protein MUP68_18325, partial [Deltaproteobacteria bacterium]|nr:hypothetical protein [Deltaproteobacteria bacterium]